jgi:CHAT domain
MSKERQYIEFYLQLRDWDQAVGQFKVAVLPSPAVGETREAVTVQYKPDDLAPYLKRLERRSIDQAGLHQLGELLAGMLLPVGEIRSLFEQALGQAGMDGGVRLRLLTHEPQLAQLPWEYTYLPIYTKGSPDYRHFLTLNPQVSLVRHEPIPRQHPQIEGRSSDKLNLLVAMANPQGDLNLVTERQNLTQSLEGFEVDGVTLDWQPMLDEATAESLSSALLKKPELFYFSGHGEFRQEGYIQLNGAGGGEPCRMSAVVLAKKLTNAGVRVAVFGTCESAKRDGVSEWAGVAPTLVAEGVPIVVAMQYPVFDTHAIAFSKAFYTALAAGLSVDEAVTTGRLAMLGAGDGELRHLGFVDDDHDADQSRANVQWGVPVLYMRSADSVIFPTRGDSTKAEELRTLLEQNIGAIRDSRDFVGIDIEEISHSVHVKQEIKTVENTQGMIGMKIGKL